MKFIYKNTIIHFECNNFLNPIYVNIISCQLFSVIIISYYCWKKIKY